MKQALSMRTSRTTGGIHSATSPSNNIHLSRSAPLNLETVNSDDSSVFSGLLASTHDTSRGSESLQEQENYDGNSQRKDSARFINEKMRSPSSKSRPTHVGRYKMKSTGSADETESEEEKTAFMSVIRSGSNSASERSYFRNMQSMADNDSAFVISSTASVTDAATADSASALKYSSAAEYRASRANKEDPYFLYDQDASTMSYGSVNEIPRPKGMMKLVSEVEISDQDNEPGKDESNEERITTMLQDYERQMNANLKTIKEQDEEQDFLSELQDVIPRRVKSEEERQVITYSQAKKLQRILHQARKEVEVLRDNNEQFVSEIEQAEEENESEKKLMEERTKQKMAELKALYHAEVDALITEKDAAIVEANRQAVRYGESGRKQISTLKTQIEKLKSQANSAIKQTVEDAMNATKRKKDDEMTARLGALRKSYESQLEKERAERERQVREAVNEGVSSITQRMLADRDREVSETMHVFRIRHENDKNQALHALNMSLDESKTLTSALRRESEATIRALQSVKENLNTHYPEQMEELRKKNISASGPLMLLQSGQQAAGSAERLFKEVIAAFAFLLDSKETKIASAQYLVDIETAKKERNEVYVKARKELMMRHRTEMEQARKLQEDSKDKISRLEESLKNLGREKRFVEDKHRRAVETHRTEVQKISAEKDAIHELEKGRKELAVAMAAGQLELAYTVARTVASERDHFLKPKALEPESSKRFLKEQDKDSHHISDQLHVLNPPSFESHERRSLDSRDDIDSNETGEPSRPTNMVSVNAKKRTPIRNDKQAARTVASEREHFLKPKTLEPESSKRVLKEQDKGSHHISDQLHALQSPSFESHDRRSSDSRDDIDSNETREPSRPTNTVSVNAKKRTQMPNDKQTPSASEIPPPPPPPPAPPAHSAPLSRGKKEDFSALKAQSTDSIENKGSHSESSHSSRRRKKTVLVRVKNQSKEASEKKVAVVPKRRNELATSKDGAAESLKKKSFAILRSFKAARSSTPPKDPVTSTQGKEPEGKIESPRNTTSLPRRARKIRGFFDTKKSDDSGSRRGSFADESLSSLKADTGATSPRASKPEHGYQKLGSTTPDNFDPSNDVKDTVKESPVSIDDSSVHSIRSESSEDKRSSGWKNRNPLGMFTNAKEKTPQDDQKISSDSSLDEVSVESTSFEQEVVDNSQNQRDHKGESDEILKLKKSWPPVKHMPTDKPIYHVASIQTICGPLKEKSAAFQNSTNPLHNLKKSTLPGIQFDDSEKSLAPASIINGKKPSLPSWATGCSEQLGRDGTFGLSAQHSSAGDSKAENEFPAAINVRSSSKKQVVITPAVNGHTLCLRPLPVENGKAHESVSSFGADSHGFRVGSGGTSETATATSTEHDELLNHGTQSQKSQLRNYGPLEDDDSDYGSSDESVDKYASFEPPAQFSPQHYLSAGHKAGKHAPVVISRNVEDSPVLYMNNSTDDSSHLVVQGNPIYRQPELSAFIPSPKRVVSEIGSTTGSSSSQATTAVTAHTFRSGLQTEPRKLLPKSPRDLLRRKNLPQSTEGSTRRAANFTTLRARRGAALQRAADI